MTEYLGEFIGTLILVAFGGGVVAGVVLKGTKASGGGWLLICIAWGMAVTLAIYAVGNISGAHINPAVSLGFAMIGKFPWQKVPGYLAAQLMGAFSGGVIVWLNYFPHWKKTEDSTAKLVVFSTIPAERNYFFNFVSEFIGTFFLIFGLLFIGANDFTEGLNPIVVGALISAIGFSFGGTTGFAINPARDLGPRIAHFVLPIHGKGNSDWSYSWIPVLAPATGGIVGALVYNALFI
ncbi:MAG: aquaporin family protein [Bacteroidales bacterium]|nr:aquaporin family protein [Bacteroidales bacterium]